MEFLWLIGIVIALLASAIKNYREQTKTVFLILLPMIVCLLIGSLTFKEAETFATIIISIGFLSIPLWVYIVSKIQEQRIKDLNSLNDERHKTAKENMPQEENQTTEVHQKSKVKK